MHALATRTLASIASRAPSEHMLLFRILSLYPIVHRYIEYISYFNVLFHSNNPV